MKLIKFGLLIVLAGVTMTGVIACSAQADAETTQTTSANIPAITTDRTQTTISQDVVSPGVTADGRLAFVEDKALTFRTSGIVDKVNVKELDKVTKGQVLAKLETDALENSLARADVAVTQAEAGVTQAEIGLQNAQIALDQTLKTYTVIDVKAALADLDAKKKNLQDSLTKLSAYGPTTPGYAEYEKTVAQAQAMVSRAQDTLDGMLSGFGTKDEMVKEQQVELAQKSLELAHQSLSLAEQSKKLAQKQLDDASIVAPFDGVIAKVNVKEGDFLSPAAYAVTVAIDIIQPDRMELALKINEMDIPGIRLGQKVTISVYTLPGEQYEGVVTSVSTLPAVALNVVSYEVKTVIAVPSRSGLKAGMGATATIITGE
jgi:HlyD family secretion protein